MKKLILSFLIAMLTMPFNLMPVVAATDIPAQEAGLVMAFTGLTSLIALIMFVFSMVLPILFIALAIGGVVIWVWMLIDLLQRDEKDFPEMNMKDQKILWLLIILLASTIGALIYYFMVYRASKIKR